MITSAALATGILAVAALIGASISVLAYFAQSWRSVILTLLAGLITTCIGVATRHIQVVQNRRPITWPSTPPPSQDAAASAPPPNEYYLFVLGSGGHTKEMLMMMDDGTRDFGAATHRRYLISSGDSMSENHLEDYERELRASPSSSPPGTYDKRVVTRARRVHQPLRSTPWTSLLSVLDIFPVLLVPPETEGGGILRFPALIFSNGPATGFFVALAVHVLKMLGLVPGERMKFVYIESWARVATLSLTGKLLYYAGLADAFYVQHEEVAARYGLVNAGEMVFNARRLEEMNGRR